MSASSTQRTPAASSVSLRAKPIDRSAVASALSEEVAATSGGKSALARRIERTEGVVRDLCKGAQDLTVVRAAALGAPGAWLLRRVAAAIDESAPPVHREPEQHLLAMAAELGDLAREQQAAIADGRYDDAERARMRAKGRALHERVTAFLLDL